eukprot:2498176-Amphidinium_carterae.1
MMLMGGFGCTVPFHSKILAYSETSLTTMHMRAIMMHRLLYGTHRSTHAVVSRSQQVSCPNKPVAH